MGNLTTHARARAMLFNSFPFLLVFLPAALLIQALAERFTPRLRLQVLLGLSLVFYGYWDWRFVPLMVASTCPSLVSRCRSAFPSSLFIT